MPRSNTSRKRRKSRRQNMRGGCSPLGSAILPFGLLGFQKYVQSYTSRSNKMRSRRSRKQSNR